MRIVATVIMALAIAGAGAARTSFINPESSP